MKSLIILDRDGILNDIVRDPLSGEKDSPMAIEQVKVFPWVPTCLRKLNDLGYELAIATNQPSAAKKRNNKNMLNKIHKYILTTATFAGATINSSHICFHRAEDNCECRKPKTGMLETAFATDNYDKSKSWMVGDRWSDVVCGATFGIKTALVGSLDERDMHLEKLREHKIEPTYSGADLRDFVKYLVNNN